MSMSADTIALPCPACASRGASAALNVATDLDGHGCQRCGGVLLTAVGSERLLHVELALDRAMLLEIAQNFGGRRYACPACTSKMRALMLRGVDVDLCFHCAALWLDDGELERLSAGRYRSTTRLHGALVAGAVATVDDVGGAEAVVRFDAHHPVRKLSGGGALLSAAALLWLASNAVTVSVPMIVAAAGLGVVAFALDGRHNVVDVFPRARRLLRSRKRLAANPRDKNAEALDDSRFVLMRPFGPMTETSLVDGCGRTIVAIAVTTAAVARREAQTYARKLGAPLVVHPKYATSALSASPTPHEGLAFVPTTASTIVFRPQPLTTSQWRFMGTIDGTFSFTLTSAVPARGDEDNDERLQLCFHLDSADGAVLARIHDDKHGHTVFVDGAGEPLASLRRRRLAGVCWHTISRAKTAHRLHLLDPPLSSKMVIVDDTGAQHATVDMRHGALKLTTMHNTVDDGLLVLLLFVQVVLGAVIDRDAH